MINLFRFNKFHQRKTIANRISLFFEENDSIIQALLEVAVCNVHDYDGFRQNKIFRKRVLNKIKFILVEKDLIRLMKAFGIEEIPLKFNGRVFYYNGGLGNYQKQIFHPHVLSLFKKLFKIYFDNLSKKSLTRP